MEEKEAKKKICPVNMAKVFKYCVASDCMMWRRIVTCEEKDKKGYCGIGGKP